ncbi:MAG: RDD family protein [Usitatibacter sp.]
MSETAAAAIDPPIAPPEASPYSGFWRRAAALVIDNFVLLLPLIALSYYVHPLLGVALILAYGAYFEASERRATPGKIACGIVVTGLEGERISFPRALGRQVLKLLGNALSAITWLVFFLPAMFTRRHQGLHDLIVSTVVRRQPGRGIPDIAVAILGGLLPAVFFVGLLAGIAVPAYQDYVLRSRVGVALGAMEPYQRAVEGYFAAHQNLPRSIQELGLGMPTAPEVKSFAMRDGRIIMEPSGFRPTGVLILTPKVDGKAIEWMCGSDGLRPAMVPARCRAPAS